MSGERDAGQHAVAIEPMRVSSQILIRDRVAAIADILPIGQLVGYGTSEGALGEGQGLVDGSKVASEVGMSGLGSGQDVVAGSPLAFLAGHGHSPTQQQLTSVEVEVEDVNRALAGVGRDAMEDTDRRGIGGGRVVDGWWRRVSRRRVSGSGKSGTGTPGAAFNASPSVSTVPYRVLRYWIVVCY